MVEWNLQKKYNGEKRNIKINRYYHLYKENELKNQIPLDKVKILREENEYNNWIIELEKL